MDDTRAALARLPGVRPHARRRPTSAAATSAVRPRAHHPHVALVLILQPPGGRVRSRARARRLQPQTKRAARANATSAAAPPHANENGEQREGERRWQRRSPWTMTCVGASSRGTRLPTSIRWRSRRGAASPQARAVEAGAEDGRGRERRVSEHAVLRTCTAADAEARLRSSARSRARAYERDHLP